jgi:nitrile hydratase accessory protein
VRCRALLATLVALAEPRQAQAFALAVKLSEHGHFTWKEWAAALADELKATDDRGEPDDGTHYCEYWGGAGTACGRQGPDQS